MKQMLKIIWAISCALFLPMAVCAGSDMNVAELVNRFNQRYPREKVFLHFDNTAYYQNEIIWWKAYLLRTDNDSLGCLSRVLYVELVDPSGEILETKKCLVENGCANGEFLLSRYTQSGLYEVRAYTRYMLNWGDDCVFTRALPVFKKPSERGNYSERRISSQVTLEDGASKEGRTTTADGVRYTVRFFPEGGSLVKGQRGRMAFEVTDGNGLGVSANGTVRVGSRDVAAVTTIHEGRGVFEYTPTNDKAALRLTLPDGKTRSFKLPEAENAGWTMTVDALAPDRVTWRTAYTPCLEKNDNETATILIHNGKAKTVESPLMRSDMPEGCSQLALVDSDGHVLCSRMVFNYLGLNVRKVAVSAADSAIWPDKQMSLDIAADTQGSLSLSVCDAETQLAAETHNAATWLLLTSELKGYIRNSKYYLEKDDREHRQAADLLMMVQGWRKYDVERMDGVKAWKKVFPVERGLLIDGRLKAYNRRSRIDGANLKVTLVSSLGSVLSGDVTTDSAGYYVFEVPECVGDWGMRMHTTLNDKDRRYYISINRNFSPAVTMPFPEMAEEDCPIVPDMTFAVDRAHIDSIPMDLRAHWLQQVEVKGKREWRSPREFWERESQGAKNASVRYDMAKAADIIADNGEEAPTLVEWLKSKNPLFDGFDNITGEQRAENAADNLFGDGPTYGGKGIVWMVNNWFVCGTGMPSRGIKDMTANKRLAANDVSIPYDISEIRSVYISTAIDDWKRILVAPQLEGNHYATVFIYTKPHSLVGKLKGERRTTFRAYSAPENYGRMMTLMGDDIDGGDYRRTLYWNPNVALDAAGKGKVHFKNNSTSRHMTVSVAGFTKDGRPLIKR